MCPAHAYSHTAPQRGPAQRMGRHRGKPAPRCGPARAWASTKVSQHRDAGQHRAWASTTTRAGTGGGSTQCPARPKPHRAMALPATHSTATLMPPESGTTHAEAERPVSQSPIDAHQVCASRVHPVVHHEASGGGVRGLHTGRGGTGRSLVRAGARMPSFGAAAATVGPWLEDHSSRRWQVKAHTSQKAWQAWPMHALVHPHMHNRTCSHASQHADAAM